MHNHRQITAEWSEIGQNGLEIRKNIQEMDLKQTKNDQIVDI